ncbi:YggT family protein [Roseateles oligotrophus]|uniref:YggT family protein n=1 Tax=Roseateles oligotrophus TaxID=1769250 RepID=A0ABT2Y8S2_9BURK|nr:YggT family protein [Roseateles oligotrophus]MCV2366700.1 YggT family protein [Roseateles oligotrophus]
MLIFASALKMWVEIALMALAGQGLLALLAGQARARNSVYRLLQWLTAPLLAGLRRFGPGLGERRLRWLLVALLLLLWLLATGLKLRYCLIVGLAQCR